MKFIDDAKLKAAVWWRERKEKAEERKAAKAALAHAEHGHGRFFLLTVPAVATICAAVVEWYWALLFCIEATGHIDWNWETGFGSTTPAENAWNFAFAAHIPVLVGLIAATAPIVMLSMVWLPVQFAMRGAGRVRRGSIIAVGILANILVIVSGTVVMNYNRQAEVRDAAVVEQTAAQGRAAIDARLAFEQEQLRLALANDNPYLNQATNVGAEEWERSYVAQARATNDPRLPQLERALGAARAADQRRANIERLTVERATAAPEAASAANVTDTVGAELNTFAQYVEVWRPPFIALICTLIGIFGTWWVIAMLERMNPRDVLRSGWADEGHRIEDHSKEEPIVPQPMKPAREVVTDAETGEELVRITPKPHWRKTKGKKHKLDVQPEIPPDETGVTADGGNRIARTVAGPIDLDNPGVAPSAATAQSVIDEGSQRDDRDREEKATHNSGRELGGNLYPYEGSDQQAQSDNDGDASLQSSDFVQETPPEELGDDDAAFLDEAPVEPVSADEREEPETDERRMIAANVAAE